jgi:hypothetical protein
MSTMAQRKPASRISDFDIESVAKAVTRSYGADLSLDHLVTSIELLRI